MKKYYTVVFKIDGQDSFMCGLGKERAYGLKAGTPFGAAAWDEKYKAEHMARLYAEANPHLQSVPVEIIEITGDIQTQGLQEFEKLVN